MCVFLTSPYLALVDSLPEVAKVLFSRKHPVSTHLNESETPMKINSRFAKTTVAAALVVSTGAATLGITSFVSAEV